MSKTLFKQGAGLIPSLAFLFSSTNLVIELGIILWLLMGWQFTAAGIDGKLSVLIAIMTLLVKLTYPAALVERGSASRRRGHRPRPRFDGRRGPQPRGAPAKSGHAHRDRAELRHRHAPMLWKDVAIGFFIAGAVGGVRSRRRVAASVPARRVARARNCSATPQSSRSSPSSSFVCSIGNVPMAAVLWTSGISFGGVLAFLYADLIVLPLLDVYRKYYGLRMMLYIAGIFFVTMVSSAILMDLTFSALHLIPVPNPNIRAGLTTFSFNYTFWLNVAFGLLGLYLWRLDAAHPMHHGCD